MLKSTLAANAISCLGFGALFAVFPQASADVIGTPPVWLVLVLGLGLVINGLALMLTARKPAPSRGEVLQFVAGDALWVIATGVLIATGIWIEAVIPAVLVALWVGACGVVQWLYAPEAEQTA